MRRRRQRGGKGCALPRQISDYPTSPPRQCASGPHSRAQLHNVVAEPCVSMADGTFPRPSSTTDAVRHPRVPLLAAPGTYTPISLDSHSALADATEQRWYGRLAQENQAGPKGGVDEVFAVPSLCGVTCDMPRSSLFLTLTAGCVPRPAAIPLTTPCHHPARPSCSHASRRSVWLAALARSIAANVSRVAAALWTTRNPDLLRVERLTLSSTPLRRAGLSGNPDANHSMPPLVKTPENK